MVNEKTRQEAERLEKIYKEAEEKCMEEFLKNPSSSKTIELEKKFIEAFTKWKYYYFRHLKELLAEQQE